MDSEPETMLFQYAQLTSGAIRLIRFSPRSTRDDVHVKLEHRLQYTDEDIHYDVLSYKPNSSAERKGITLNGRTRMIDANAWQVLSAMHLRHRECLFWIDALSINHGDEAEKISQLAQLKQIYASADRVLISTNDSFDFHDFGKAEVSLQKGYGLHPGTGEYDGYSALKLSKFIEDYLKTAEDGLALQAAREVVLLNSQKKLDLESLRSYMKQRREVEREAQGSRETL